MSNCQPPFDALPPGFDCLVIIVTHNSERHLQWCLDGLCSSTSTLAVRIVDSGSKDLSYLDKFRTSRYSEVRRCANVGFVAANNMAIEKLNDVPWVLFLNPDARIEGKILDEMMALAARPAYARTGMFTLPLVRFDIETGRPLDVYDSVGIGSTWYGRWQDLLSGEQSVKPAEPKLQTMANPQAICGALMLIRSVSLQSTPDSTGAPGFERKYYMYKEDIELSLRLRKSGWALNLLPQFIAYHCRGWNKQRTDVPYWARAESARNDLDVAMKFRWRSIPFAICKLLWVKAFEQR